MQIERGIALPMSLTDVEFRVIRHIHQKPGKSRTDIAAALGLSKSMLTKAVTNFAEKGLIVEETVVPEAGERGKPPILISLRNDACHSIGVYVNRQMFAVVRADLRGNVCFSAIKEMQKKAAIEDILREVDSAVKAHPAPVIGIGHAVPAIVGDNGDLFEVTPTQASLPLSEIAEGLANRFEIPVFWENDAFCSATYEANREQADKRCIFYTAFGFGVGGGAVVNGSLIRGAFNQAANIGGLIPETGPRPSLTDLAVHLHIELNQLTETRLLRRFEAGDPDLMDWIEDRAPRLSEPFSAAVQFLNPDAIILGGFFPKVILEEIRNRVRLDVYDVSGRRPLTKPALLLSQHLGPSGIAKAAAFLPVYALILGQPGIPAAQTHPVSEAPFKSSEQKSSGPNP